MEYEETVQKALIYDLRKDKTLIGWAKISPEFIFLDVNEILCGYLSCTKAQLIGLPFTTITLPEDNEIDTMNAQAVKDGKFDHYQFPKRYKPAWLQSIVYVIIDVLGVRGAQGQFLYYDVQILEITKEEYLRLKKSVLKQESENLLRLLSWTGGLNLKQLKGLAIWMALVAMGVTVAAQMKIEWIRGLLEKYLQQ